MKKQLTEQANDLAKMVARDIEIESIRHETDELRKIIEGKDKQIKNLTKMYESTLAELQNERAKIRKGRIITFTPKGTV